MWAEKELPDWQSDAARRILTQDCLSDNDKAEIMLFIKKRYQLIPDIATVPIPQRMQMGMISGSSGNHSKINLKTIKELNNVNALPDGAEINFGEQGITIIYGKNGAGKSGYARVLKRACKARDYDHIHTNVYSKSNGGPATATFIITANNGSESEIKWIDGQPSNDVLSNICVFDAKCARIILNEKNEISYLPYGAHLFSSLAELLQELQQKLKAEKVTPARPAYDDIPVTTIAGQYLANLTHATTLEMIDQYVQWDDAQSIELQQLLIDVAKVEAENPVSQINMLRSHFIT
jgi:energy-coupling factor transporter ATP-binding protein EcfA2